MSFVERKISVQISLANGIFSGGSNSQTLSGLRMSMRIKIPGGGENSTLEGAIFGMKLSDMNQLSLVGTQLHRQPNNKIMVMAGDDASGKATVYNGTLFNAYVDAQSMPQVAFRVSGMTALYEGIKPAKSMSINGSGDVAKMMGQLAQDMGLTFENNNVNVKLSNPYLSGSARMQALTLAQHAGIEHLIHNGTLAIWMPGQARQGSTPMISPQTGMVGYPMFNQASVIVKTLFDPNIKYGGSVKIQSDLTPACGTFVVKNIELSLDCLTPHGQWFATIEAVPIKPEIET